MTIADEAAGEPANTTRDFDGEPVNVPNSGFVYLMGVLDGCHKIGRSSDPHGRMGNIGACLPLKLGIVHLIATANQSWLERTLHRAYATSRVGGEWFRLTALDFAEIRSFDHAHGPEDLPERLVQFCPATDLRPVTFGEAVKAAIKAAGLKPTPLAKALGTTGANMSGIISGESQLLRNLDMIGRIEDAVGVKRGGLLKYLPPGHSAHRYYAAEVAAAKPAAKPPKKYPRREEPAPPGVTELEVWGTIAAGPDDEPTVFAEGDRPTVLLEGDFHPDAYALQITGESCSQWGIVHGDFVAIAPVASPHAGRFHALRSVGGLHTLKAYYDGQWWQFRPGDADPVPFPLPGDTYLVGVVAGGKYAERFYRPGKRGTKGRKG